MVAKVIGIILLIAGAAVIITGVMAIGGLMDGEPVRHSTIVIRMFAGFFLLAGGMFTTAIAFSSHMTRGVTAVFKRLRGGSRIDEEIARLAKLRGDGYITGEEYEAAKKKLLGDL